MSSKNVIDLRGGVKRPVLQPTLEFPRPRERPGRRISPVRRQRRRTRLIIVFILIILIGGAAYGISWASYLPQYTVSTITVEGASTVPAKLIYDYIETQLYAGTYPFLSKDNIFLYNPGALQREIVGFFPRIASASVSRSSLLATAVTVTVQERQPFALWCQPAQAGSDTAESDCYEMDNTGFIFAQALPVASAAATLSAMVAPTTTIASDATTTTNASSTSIAATSPIEQRYVFQGGIGTSAQLSASSTSASSTSPKSPIGQTFVGAHMPGIIALLQILGQAGYTPTGATVENAQDFWVPLTQGFYIKASFGEDPENIVNNLKLVLSSDAFAGNADQLEYVDLRFGDRVYYKLQGAAETQTPSK